MRNETISLEMILARIIYSEILLSLRIIYAEIDFILLFVIIIIIAIIRGLFTLEARQVSSNYPYNIAIDTRPAGILQYHCHMYAIWHLCDS